jgi:hypothetical protein
LHFQKFDHPHLHAQSQSLSHSQSPVKKASNSNSVTSSSSSSNPSTSLSAHAATSSTTTFPSTTASSAQQTASKSQIQTQTQAQTQSQLPLCRFGASCYRKSKEHLSQYRHVSSLIDAKAHADMLLHTLISGQRDSIDDAKSNSDVNNALTLDFQSVGSSQLSVVSGNNDNGSLSSSSSTNHGSANTAATTAAATTASPVVMDFEEKKARVLVRSLSRSLSMSFSPAVKDEVGSFPSALLFDEKDDASTNENLNNFKSSIKRRSHENSLDHQNVDRKDAEDDVDDNAHVFAAKVRAGAGFFPRRVSFGKYSDDEDDWNSDDTDVVVVDSDDDGDSDSGCVEGEGSAAKKARYN